MSTPSAISPGIARLVGRRWGALTDMERMALPVGTVLDFPEPSYAKRKAGPGEWTGEDGEHFTEEPGEMGEDNVVVSVPGSAPRDPETPVTSGATPVSLPSHFPQTLDALVEARLTHECSPGSNACCHCGATRWGVEECPTRLRSLADRLRAERDEARRERDEARAKLADVPTVAQARHVFGRIEQSILRLQDERDAALTSLAAKEAEVAGMRGETLRAVDDVLAEMQREHRARAGDPDDGNRAANVLGFARARLSNLKETP